MPEITVNGARIHYEESGTPLKGTVVFSHGLLWSSWMFEDQAKALSAKYRCIRYDHRGQGQSEVTADGYDIDNLAVDAAEIIENLGAGPCHFVGLSMGGFVGMRLAARKPALIRSLTLMETSADPEPPENVPKYRAMGFVARWIGLKLVAARVMPIMFSQTFLKDPARKELREQCLQRLLAIDVIGMTRALKGVIERKPVYDELTAIKCPTLVMVGEEDAATVPARAERIAARIGGAKLVRIPGAGHTSSVEAPGFVTEKLAGFLDGLG
jgi:3-oxoadipate enol-lactonase